eukprot:TRINITY_DN12588_c0_g1_i1.p1 TRINITY_DN12588_c0_g1~~TRINITY_DN12588_c0_g1_i1.p1  ORF type:complete len:100 (-),score=34.69 TRINITY_DN12588_c0_g1_i1:35-334(-)
MVREKTVKRLKRKKPEKELDLELMLDLSEDENEKRSNSNSSSSNSKQNGKESVETLDSLDEIFMDTQKSGSVVENEDEEELPSLTKSNKKKRIVYSDEE